MTYTGMFGVSLIQFILRSLILACMTLGHSEDIILREGESLGAVEDNFCLTTDFSSGKKKNTFKIGKLALMVYLPIEALNSD